MPDVQTNCICPQLIDDLDHIVQRQAAKVPLAYRDDVLQEVRLKLVSSPQSFDAVLDRSKYVAQTVWNCYRQVRRSNSRRCRRIAVFDPNCFESFEACSPDNQHDVCCDVRAAVNALNANYRDVVRCELDGDSIADFARRNQLSVETCRVRLSRAKSTLSGMNILKDYRDEFRPSGDVPRRRRTPIKSNDFATEERPPQRSVTKAK